MVISVAHEAARVVLLGYCYKFSRHNLTLAEFFACLIVRKMIGKAYRRTEDLLRDTNWCQQSGLTRVPYHATLWRVTRWRVCGQGSRPPLVAMAPSPRPAATDD